MVETCNAWPSFEACAFARAPQDDGGENGRQMSYARRVQHRLYGPSDLEALDVFLRPGRIEGLAHHCECFGRRGGRLETDVLHQPRGVGGKEDLLGDAGVVDVALDLTPAL